MKIDLRHIIMSIFSFSTELAEAAEFDVYAKYAKDVTSQQAKDALSNLLSKPEVRNKTN